jgi:hypothetical protein
VLVNTIFLDRCKVQGFKDSRVQGFKDSRIQGFKDSRIQGFKDSRELKIIRSEGVHLKCSELASKKGSQYYKDKTEPVVCLWQKFCEVF